MSVDPKLFKQVMAQWSSGITIITSLADGQKQGITANSFASVSLNPPLVSVSIDKKLFIHSIIERSGVFAANILNAEQVKWGKLFAGFYPDIEDRFAGIECETSVTGSPILPGVLGWVDCQVRHAYEAGDHSIFVGEVLAGGIPELAPPMVYHNRAWGGFVRQLPERVHITEMGLSLVPGLQSTQGEQTKELREALIAAGVTRMRLGLPDLTDTTRIQAALEQFDDIVFYAQVRNSDELEQARGAGLKQVEFTVSAIDSPSQKGRSDSQADVIDPMNDLVSRAHTAGMKLRGVIEFAFGSTRAKGVAASALVETTQRYLDLGVKEMVLEDTAGLANPMQIHRILTPLLATLDIQKVALRLNNIHHLGAANAYAGLEAGITHFDTALGGSDTGILATEILVRLLTELGIETGIYEDRLLQAAEAFRTGAAVRNLRRVR